MFTSEAIELFFVVLFVNKEKQNKSSANILRFLVLNNYNIDYVRFEPSAEIHHLGSTKKMEKKIAKGL